MPYRNTRTQHLGRESPFRDHVVCPSDSQLLIDPTSHRSDATLLKAPMQPIAQASLDPRCDDIMHLQAEQLIDGVIASV